MSELLNRYREWAHRRDERRAEQWAEKRKKGKSHFVSGYALFWCLYMSAGFIVGAFLFDDPLNIAVVVVRTVMLFLGSLIMGLVEWSKNERKYFERHPAAEETYNLTGRES